MTIKFILAAVTSGLLFAGCMPQETADTIYFNAYVWTGDVNRPLATTFGVKGNTILFVGNEYDPWQGKKTKMHDLQGKMVTPGFLDNHTHFLSGGFQLASVDLRSAGSPAEFIRRIKEFASNLEPGRWILGGNWDHEMWGGELPKRDWIDSITTKNPVFVSRLDGHMALANSLAINLAKMDGEVKTPEGGVIVRYANNNSPTGVFKDAAMNLIYSVIPEPGDAEFDEALKRAIDHSLSLGVTQVHCVGSFGGWKDLETYRRATAQNKLPLRIYSFVPLAEWKQLDTYIKQNGKGDDRLRWGGLKGFVDGSLGSTTAWFYDPYLDEPETSGLLVNDTAQIRNWILSADSAGLHTTVHAIGDRANDWLLDVFAQASTLHGPRDRRFRIEHAQHLSRNAISRFAAQDVIPSMQPYHAIDDGRWAEKRIGAERIKTTYAFRSLLDAGAPLTFGSDWTVAPLNPMQGIYAAVTRRTLDGQNQEGWVPQEKITVEEALRCYTVHNAYAGFQEHKLGALTPGYLADFVVLSENIITIDPVRIKDVKVLTTVVNGVQVYEN